jgi:membrane protein YqaA with SNARE-associated domain
VRTRFGPAERFLLIALLLIALYAIVLQFTNINAWFLREWESVERLGLSHGYWGAFLGSVLANATVIIPVPYTFLIFLIAATGLNPLFLGLISGVGAGIGEVTSYLVGMFGYAVGKRHLEKNVTVLRTLISRRPWFVGFFLFLVGASPIPDDLFMIPLGILRYHIVRAILPFMLGKVFITTVIAYAGSLSQHLPAFHDIGGPTSSVVTLLSTVIIVYLLLKVNWASIGMRLLGASHTDTPPSA